jgi:hypothetical protein
MRSASEFQAAKRFGAITARSSAGRRGAEEVAALQGQIQALQIELENPSHALALLRPRRERPRCCRAAEQRDELASPQLVELHSISNSPRQMQDIELAMVSQRVYDHTPARVRAR